jgi:hypothetical protein
MIIPDDENLQQLPEDRTAHMPLNANVQFVMHGVRLQTYVSQGVSVLRRPL